MAFGLMVPVVVAFGLGLVPVAAVAFGLGFVVGLVVVALVVVALVLFLVELTGFEFYNASSRCVNSLKH